ncbi:long chain base biosynthesis protein 1-like [Histomonas meleagridis]|uniref:long chain base biosynthesis protein 1-like n=1 Tax=Histomonas meleagridis TaxID=135588 RepID=UPI0035595447|nr:long chain base biosynthesis protein 1-like [Histomonas meleagridis]KAH0804990.1 long chain base biosynthesis protein 1-like [Histomonas meleagridis]
MIVPLLEKLVSFLWNQSPIHLFVEIGLIVFIVLLLLRSPEPIHDPTDDITEAEEDEIIADWKPKPLIPDLDDAVIDKSIFRDKTITSGPSDTIEIDGKKMINLGVPNFYGLNMNQEIIDASLAAIDKYAVGACGPRQFYGTMDVHLKVEEEMAKFLGSEETVNYCYPFATTTSIIQSLIKNSDILFVDDGAWFACQLGSELTRCKVIPYKHNDMDDLREKVASNKKTFARWDKCNRWVVTEGLFTNDGSLLDLPTLIQLRKEFCLRLIIDETYSFGCVGKTGKGLCEHYDIPRDLIEVSIGSYGPAFASLGGFSVGTKEICAHQRLASHAYIFSASPPCFNVVAATKAIEIVEQDGEERIRKLRSNIQLARNELNGIDGFDILGDEISPLIHLRLKEAKATIKEEDEILQRICDKCAEDENPVAIAKAKFVRMRDLKAGRPTIKIFISQAHSEDQIRTAISVIKNAAKSI